jgi:hypothetical protein
MTNDTEKWLSAVLFGLIIALICLWMGIERGRIIMENQYQKEAIERGFASYNSTNGVWQWNK